MIVRELINKIGFQLDEAGLRRVEQRVQGVAVKMGSMGKKLSLAVTLPLAGLAYGMVKTAADAAEQQQKFDKVFEGIGQGAEDTANRVAESFNMTGGAARLALANTGNLLQSFGFGKQASLDFAARLQGLSADLASFNQVEGGSEEVAQALTLALTGQTRGLKQYGIAIDDAEVKNQILQNRQNGITFATQRQAEAFAVLELVQKRSGNAAGAFARQQQDFDQQLKRVKNRLTDLAVGFGSILLPKVNQALNWISKFLAKFKDLDDGTRKIILVFMGFAAALGPVLYFSSKLITMLAMVRTAFGTAALAGLAFDATVWLIPAAIIALIAALALLVQDFQVWKAGGDSLFGRAFGAFDAFAENFKGMLENIKNFFSQSVTGIIEILKGFTTFLKGVFTLDMQTAVDGIKLIWQGLGDVFKGLGTEIRNQLTTPLKLFADIFGFLSTRNVKYLANLAEDVGALAEEQVSIMEEKKTGVPAKFQDREKSKQEFIKNIFPQFIIDLMNPNKATAPAIAGVPSSTSKSFNQNVNMTSNITLQIPVGLTLGEEDKYIENVRKVIAEENQKSFRYVLNQNAGGEY